MSVVLTLERGPGSRQLTVGLRSANIRDVLIGVMIVLMSWIMNEARAIREEQELTV